MKGTRQPYRKGGFLGGKEPPTRGKRRWQTKRREKKQDTRKIPQEPGGSDRPARRKAPPRKTSNPN